MEDDAGGDEKILAVPAPRPTQRYAHVVNYTDLPRITLEQIQHFFEHYKDLEPASGVKMHRLGRRRRGPRADPRRDRAREVSHRCPQCRTMPWS